MNKRIKKLWVAALRSGEYKQGRARLRDSQDRFCCLGVLCNLHAIEHPRVAKRSRHKDLYDGALALPKLQVLKWAGLRRANGKVICLPSTGRCDVVGHLVGMNDVGRSFARIADWIDSNL